MIPTIQKKTVEFVHLSRLYAARTGGHPALAPYPTLDVLLSALFGKGQADPATRRRILCAVLEEHQAAPGPLGPAIVLHAFRGMLVNLSRSLIGVDDPDDADGLVVAGLLAALPRVRPARDPDRIGMYVRQETRRAVFAVLRRDARAEEPFEKEEEKEGDEEEGEPVDIAAEDNAWSDEALHDPLAPQHGLRRRDPEVVVDPESLEPIEDRLLFSDPRVDTIPEEMLLRADGVRGGLRRLTEHLFDHETPFDRRRLYDQLVRRAKAARAGHASSPGNRRTPKSRSSKNGPSRRSS